MPARSAATSGESAGVRSSIDRWCGSKNQLETAPILQSSRKVRNPRSDPKFAANWVGFPSGSQRPLPVVSSTPSKPAMDIVFRARSWSSRRTKSSNWGLY